MELKTQIVGLHYNNTILSSNLVIPIWKVLWLFLLNINISGLLNEFMISFRIIEFTIKENLKKWHKMINLQYDNVIIFNQF
jgi:hypothetical protein